MANCNLECDDVKYTAPLTPAPLPDPDDCCGGGGGGGEGHKYTFVSTATGWQVKEDGRVIYTYTDKNDNTTYSWQATTDGWLVKDNAGNVLFTYKDKDNDTTYSFEEDEACGFKVTNSKGEVVFTYDGSACSGTTYTFEQDGVDIKVTNDKTGVVVFTYHGTVDTNTTYTYEDYKDGFKVTNSDGVVVYIYDPTLGDRSDGSYPIDTLLTTVFRGKTTISTGQILGFTPADLVVGETLVYDGVGTVGVITKDNGDGTYEVTTMTISPGSRQGVRLGSVDTEADLPATCAAAEALGWQTPQLGDFAYVIENTGGEDVISEYVITNVDDDCNLTWTFSHQFNAGNYQEQSTTGMSGMILTGGVIPGTFGTPIDPTTLIRGVMRNGVLLTPDAQGKVNVIVDDSHVIVNELPTTGIIDHVEYLVVDPTTLKVTSTWVHDPTGWYQTYEAQTVVRSHQIVTAKPTTNIEENVEYIIVDADGTHSETWVYDPTLGWIQTEVKARPAHTVVKTLPTTGIDDNTEYVQVSDLNDPVNTYVASWVHTSKGWIKVAENANAGKAHIAVDALPTTNINENAEYLLMDNVSDPDTLIGTYVRVNGNWVQTEKLENGFHIVTSLPTTNIDSKNEYIVVENLAKPDETLIGHYAYDKYSNKWISLSSKYEVNHGVTMNGYVTNAEDFQDMPVGAVAPFFGTEAPAHYLICDGTTYNIGTYPELEAFIIENYGNVNKFGGNGTTTWAVPDLRGEFLRGAGTNSHINSTTNKAEGSGAAVGNHQDATYQPVTHYFGSTNLLGVMVAKPGANTETSNTQSNWDSSVSGVSYFKDNGYGNVNSRSQLTGGTIRPTSTSVNWIIKAESTYAIVPQENQYAVNATATYTFKSAQMITPALTNVTGLSSMAAADGFVAPVDGYYSVTFMFPEVADQANSYFGTYVYVNNALVGGTRSQTGDGSASTTMNNTFSLNSGFTIKLSKGDKINVRCWVQLATYNQTQTYTRVGRASMVLLQPTQVVAKAETMLKPNTWPVGVEQNFGDGVYGMRWKGTTPGYTTTGGTAVRHDTTIGTLPDTARFIQTGGGAFISGRWEWPLGMAWGNSTTQNLAWGISIYINNDGGTAAARPVDFSVQSSSNSSGDKYDVWALYTK